MPTFHFKIRRSFVKGSHGYWAYFDLSADDLGAAYDKARAQSRGFSAGYMDGPYLITPEEYQNATERPERSRTSALPPHTHRGGRL